MPEDPIESPLDTPDTVWSYAASLLKKHPDLDGWAREEMLEAAMTLDNRIEAFRENLERLLEEPPPAEPSLGDVEPLDRKLSADSVMMNAMCQTDSLTGTLCRAKVSLWPKHPEFKQPAYGTLDTDLPPSWIPLLRGNSVKLKITMELVEEDQGKGH
jgi:hypothetical protein